MILDGFVFPGKDTENMKIFRENEIQKDFYFILKIWKVGNETDLIKVVFCYIEYRR